MKAFSVWLLVGLSALHIVQTTHAMCVATTRNLVRLKVNACQAITIQASGAIRPAHRIHKEGSSVTGVLVSGNVIESLLVWNGDPQSAEYTFESRKLNADALGSLFLEGDASEICQSLLGSETMFITDNPCCDVIPADGLCLVPGSIVIAKVENNPERWTIWGTRKQDTL